MVDVVQVRTTFGDMSVAKQVGNNLCAAFGEIVFVQSDRMFCITLKHSNFNCFRKNDKRMMFLYLQLALASL